MKINRRNFLKSISAAACTAVTASGSPLFPKSLSAQSNPSDYKLLVIELDGGVDTLALFQPDSEELKGRRKTLYAAEENLLELSANYHNPNGFRFHDSLTHLKNFYNIGMVSVINKVGLDRHSRSHELAKIYYSRGFVGKDSTVKTGWLNRLALQNDFSRYDMFDFANGSFATASGSFQPTVSGSLNGLQFGNPFTHSTSSYHVARQEQTLHTALRLSESWIARSAEEDLLKMNLKAVHEDVANMAPIAAIEEHAEATQVAPFPDTTFGRQMSDAWRVFHGLDSKVAYVRLGGFDTHANQKSRLSSNLTNLDQSLYAFLLNMAYSQMLEKTIVMIVTEFGRTIGENVNKNNDLPGTDHGFGSSVVVINQGLEGGFTNGYSARELKDHFFLPFEVNVVSIYRSIVEKMGYDADKVFEKVEPLALFT